MILSYGLDVRQLFFNFDFSYSNYIIYDFFSLNDNPDLGTEFISNMLGLWEK
jgi:hypothetical protein